MSCLNEQEFESLAEEDNIQNSLPIECSIWNFFASLKKKFKKEIEISLIFAKLNG
jgi:hypothetical protein